MKKALPSDQEREARIRLLEGRLDEIFRERLAAEEELQRLRGEMARRQVDWDRIVRITEAVLEREEPEMRFVLQREELRLSLLEPRPGVEEGRLDRLLDIEQVLSRTLASQLPAAVYRELKVEVQFADEQGEEGEREAEDFHNDIESETQEAV